MLTPWEKPYGELTLFQTLEYYWKQYTYVNNITVTNELNKDRSLQLGKNGMKKKGRWQSYLNNHCLHGSEVGEEKKECAVSITVCKNTL